jgi:gas vesicle protein
LKAENQMKKAQSKWGYPIVALCIGLGIGALAGVLLAPQSGEETRDDIIGGVTDRMEEARARTAKAARGARRFVNETKERIDDAVEAGTDAYREAKRAAS